VAGRAKKNKNQEENPEENPEDLIS